MEKLSKEEFTQMVTLLHRYVEKNMDQWELWRFESSLGKVYVNVSLKSETSDEAYSDISHLIQRQS